MDQCQVAGVLNRTRHLTLVSSAGASLASRANFSIFRNITPQQVHILIIDCGIMIGTKLANARVSVKTPASGLQLIFHIHLIAHVSNSLS
jgi:hypothetical protein